MRRGEIFSAPCIWANSEFLEVPYRPSSGTTPRNRLKLTARNVSIKSCMYACYASARLVAAYSSPRIPSTEEMLRLMRKACAVIPAQRLWINPDCGLKTRGWPEVEAALKNMVEAAHRLRATATA